MGRLGSGKRYTNAADGGANLSIGRSLDSMRRSLAQAQRNVMDGVSMAQSAEQGVEQLGAIASRLRQHAIRAASNHIDAGSRNILDRDYKALLTAYDNIVNSIDHNGKSLIGAGLEGAGAPEIQGGIGPGQSSRFSLNLSDLSLRRMGRVDPLSGASIVSSSPLSDFTINESPAVASIALSGPFTFNDTASITGSSSGPFTVDGVAQMDLSAGPYDFSGTATRTGSKTGPFTIPAAPNITGTSSPSFDVVEGENDILRLKINGTDELVQLSAGFQSISGVAGSINSRFPGTAAVEGGALVLRASGETKSLVVSGGSALNMLGLSAGASSTGQNSLVFSTDEGSFTVNLAEGTHSAGDVVSAINNVKPGSASVDGGRISLSAGGGQSFVAMGSGSANSVLGMSAGTTRSTDNFRYRVNYGGWQSIDLPEGQMSASDLSDVINARTPGIASVVGGRVRLRSDSGAAQIHIGSGTANGLLGVTTNQEENGENLLSLRVNGVTRSTTLGAGTYSSSEIADAYNGLFSGVASVVGGKVKLSVSGSGASINSGSSALNGALGIPDGALAEANNILKFRVDGGGMETVALSAGTFTASQLVDQINAVIPGLAQTSGGNVVVSSSGSNASIAVGNGSANGVVGLSNGQSVSTPTQGKDLVFSVNGESTTVHFDPGSYTPQDVINQINSSRPGFATVLGDGRIRLATQSVGNVNTVSIGSGSINGTLGISAGQSATGVDTDSLALTSLQSPEAAGQAIERATQAIEELALAGADIGAFLNKSDVVSEGLRTELATSEAARSRIEDVDIAREATAIAKADITSNTAASLMSAIAVMERSVAELFTLVQKP